MASQGGEEEEVPKKWKRRRTLCNLLSFDASISSSSSFSSSSTSTDKTSSCYNFNDFITDVTSTSTDKTSSCYFNDFITADVKLHLHLYDDESNFGIFDLNDHPDDLNHRDEVYLYLHSDVLRRRSQYFSALLSGRWQRRRREEESNSSSRRYFNLTYKVPASSMKSIDTHQIVIKLLYSTDVNFSETINTVSSALSILPVAIELLFEDCVKACIRLIEALPWTEEEEQRVLDLIPLLTEEESQELLSRVSPVKIHSSDEMLLRLIQEVRFNQHKKDFVGKMLRDFSSRDSVRLALDQAFEMTLKLLKQALQEACSSERPQIDWWEEEKQTAVADCGDHLFWLLERMIELRVADTTTTTTLDRWIDEEGDSLTENLQEVCSDKTFSSQFLFNVMQCTWKLADAVASGSIVADRQDRMKLVKAWLPVVLCFKDDVRPELLTHDFEEPFFKIISTLPMSESQELLLQCLGFSTHNNVNNELPHLESAYKTWFRRAATFSNVNLFWWK